jgi:L-fuconolactonase
VRIDAHHHLWRYSAAEYAWIDGSMAALQRDFLVPELERELAAAGVGACVAVQARQTVEETEWLLGLAERSAVIGGVVGWADIASAGFAAELESLCARPLLKALRHVVQAEPDGFLDGAEFNRGIAAMRDMGLVYDLLIVARQLEEAVRFVDMHPQQVFVLDHIAKPEIAEGEIAAWSAGIQELARRENVICKLSGMVTEADWGAWTPEGLRPYFDVVLGAFGPSRLMVGSDWPVMTVACSYARWWDVVEGWLAELSGEERAEIEGGVAGRVYRLTSG